MRRFTLLFIILCTGTVIAASFTSTRFPNNFFVMHDEYALPLPDSTYEDSTNIYLNFLYISYCSLLRIAISFSNR